MNHDAFVEAIANAPTPGAAAGVWWASVLRDPKFDNGATDDANVFARMLQTEQARNNRPDSSALEVFSGLLAKEVDDRLAANTDDPQYRLWLDVDYHPNAILADTARIAGLVIPMFGWPSKTSMWVRHNSVSVSYGYQAENEAIWVRPAPRA